MADINRRVPSCEDCDGERGEHGERGERGERGRRGRDGRDGDTGPTGPTGSTGPEAAAGFLTGAAAPDASEVPAAIGTFYKQLGTSIMWIKYGAQDYNWTPYSAEMQDGYIYRDDYLSSVFASQNVVGGATGGWTGEVGHTGLWTGTVTSTVTPDRARIFSIGGVPASTAPPVSVVAGGGQIYTEVLLKFPTLSDGVENFSWRGPGIDTLVSVEPTTGLYFEVDPQNHAGSNNVFGVTANGGLRNKVDLGIAPVAATYLKLRAELNANNTLARFLINDVLINTSALNMPATGFGGIVHQIVKTLGVAVARSVVVDYSYFAQLFSPQR